MVKLVALLAHGRAAPPLPGRHLFCAAEPTNAILASLAGLPERPQSHAGLVLAWPRDAREPAAVEAALAPHAAVLHAAEEVRHWDELGRTPPAPVLLCYFVRRRADLSFDAFRTTIASATLRSRARTIPGSRVTCRTSPSSNTLDLLLLCILLGSVHVLLAADFAHRTA